MRVVFVGDEAAGARALGRVARSDHTLVGVLTSTEPGGQAATVGRRRLGALTGPWPGQDPDQRPGEWG